MYQSGREGDEAKKRNSPAFGGRVGIYGIDAFRHITCRDVSSRNHLVFGSKRKK